MAFIKTYDREKAYRALINEWLKDKRKYCNNCDDEFILEFMPCCEDPQISNNSGHTTAVIQVIKMIKETRDNKFASTKDKSIRWGVSLPPRLYRFLDNYEKKLEEGNRLFKTNEDMRWFAKTFPVFAVAEKI